MILNENRNEKKNSISLPWPPAILSQFEVVSLVKQGAELALIPSSLELPNERLFASEA
jgi:hypothetical protein